MILYILCIFIVERVNILYVDLRTITFISGKHIMISISSHQPEETGMTTMKVLLVSI